MKRLKRNLLSVLCVLFISLSTAFANPDIPVNNPVEMADPMRSSGKIYVVVAAVVIIVVVLLGYLIVTDRRLRKLEREVKNIQ